MKTKNEPWKISKFVRLEEKIDPNPPFQRGEVWKLPAKQLLIDSILCNFDIPKVYLHDMGTTVLYRYAVADGQQRLRAIWQFLADRFPAADASYDDNATWTGKYFSELDKEQQRALREFTLVTAVIYQATTDEVRELFWRLQQGSQLNPAEKRNCLPSKLGDLIRMRAETHPLFLRNTTSLFSPDRRKRDDTCAHAFALEINGTSQDIKAPNIRQLYETYGDELPDEVAKKVNKVLSYMNQMDQAHRGCIKRKWGFVDLYLLISRKLAKLPKARELTTRFLAFEKRRLAYNANPEQLLEGSRIPDKNRRLYEYIIAFKTSGAEADNLKTRHSVMVEELLG